MKRPSDKAFGSLITIGLWLALGGFALAGTFLLLSALPLGKAVSLVLMGLAGTGVVCFFAGLIVLCVSLTAGLRAGGGSSKKVVTQENVKVIARYAMNGSGEMLFDTLYMDPSDPHFKLYVRLQAPNSASQEFRCNGLVWGQCGESMVGTAMIQGDWVGQFTPTMGPSQSSPHLREVAKP